MMRAAGDWCARQLDGPIWACMRLSALLRPRAPWIAQLIRRSALLVWWTLTGQVRAQFKAWTRARAMRSVAPPTRIVPVRETVVDPTSLRLPRAEEPLVSIIIPTYGQLPYTLRGLAAIADHTTGTAIEVIVIDDAFPDAAVGDTLSKVDGIRLIRNETNLGFIGTCNTAARSARGSFLLFLNNDTEVQEDWLDPMLALFRERADVGAVGAKLLYPDGRLQEAGGIIWRDASGWNFGRLGDPDAPVYNYVRPVDYCSGAALLVRRSVFLDLDGFDPRYAPAYFEDADLSFRLRAIGLQTLYQPRARVVHHEGVSHGTDLAVGIKAYQTRNRVTFVQAWGEILRREHHPNGTKVLRARDRALDRPVVLIIDHYLPQPDRDAGSRTMIGFVRALMSRGMVVKFWPHNLCHMPSYTEALQDIGVEVFHGPNHPGLRAWLRENGEQIDHVLISRPDMAEDCLPILRELTRARISYYGHDLHFRRMRQQGEYLRDEAQLRAADRMEERERAIWRQVDAVLYPSEEEARMVSLLSPSVAAHAVLPYAFTDFSPPRSPPTESLVLFVAGFSHPPNVEGACWFAEHVMPLLRQRAPGTWFAIVGSNPTARVRELTGADISIHANVSDAELADWYARARVAVVPLMFGAGVKLKVVEAMVKGVPLVTTPVGAQGLPGLEAVTTVARDPFAFARGVTALLVDNAAWVRHAETQTRYVANRFSPDAQAESLMRAMTAPAEDRLTVLSA